MSDAIMDALGDILDGRSLKRAGAEIGVAHTTLSRMRTMRPTRSTLRALERIATPEQMRRLLVALRAIRMPHPEPAHPDHAAIARVVSGADDPLPRMILDADVYREAWRLALAALRVAAVTAPSDEQHRVVAALAARMARLTDRLAGVSHG